MSVITFGGKVKMARWVLRMTLQQAARKLGVAPSYLSLVERRRLAPPSRAVIKRMCRVYDLPYPELLIRGWLEKAPRDVTPDGIRHVLAQQRREAGDNGRAHTPQ